MHVFIGSDDGEVYMMGSNDQGQLGNKERTTRLTPERVNTLDLYRVVHLALGQQHSLALTEEVLIGPGLTDLCLPKYYILAARSAREELEPQKCCLK